MNLKSVIERECFTVAVTWEEIPIIKKLVEENDYYKQILDNDAIEFRFISFMDKKNQPLDNSPAYYCYIGMAGEHDMFELGIFGGTREQIVNSIKSGKLVEDVEKYPNGYDRYVFNKFIEYLKHLMELHNKINDI